MNNTHVIDSNANSPLNSTQTLDCGLNSTQTVDSKANTTQTLELAIDPSHVAHSDVTTDVTQTLGEARDVMTMSVDDPSLSTYGASSMVLSSDSIAAASKFSIV